MPTSKKNNNTNLVKSTHDLSRLMHDVLEFAKKEGATDAFVSVNHDSGFSIDVRMGEVETVAFSEDSGVSVTVYFGHKKGVASSTDTSEKALAAMVHAACDIAKVSAADPCFGLAERELLSDHHPDLDLFHPWNVTPTEAIEKALSCEKKALSMDKRICNSDGVNLSTYEFCHGFANTHGGEGLIHSTRHSVSCSLIAKEGETMQRDYDYTSARDSKHLLSPELLGKSAGERAISRLGARKIKTQKAPVIFSSRLSSSLFSNFIGAISGSNLYRKNTFLLDSLGKQIFPEMVQIYERPQLLGGLGSAPFDSDGVTTRNNVFVKDGCVNQYILGCYSARKLGMQTTANSGGVFNLFIEATTGNLEEILNEVGTGLLVTELMGSGVNILTGDYSRGATGFWVENGKIQYPVEEITIAGNLKNMFKNIVAIGNDINPNIATHCGSVVIAEMMIGGH